MAPNRLRLSLAAAVSLLGASGAAAEQPPATLEVLLAEVRLLRQALERQVALQARAQLVVGRLALQDQRLARARSELQRAESEAQNLTSQRDQMQHALGELRRASETADASRLPDIEREQRMMQQRLQDLANALASAEAHRGRAAQAAAAEEARYEEIERWFDDLERELSRSERPAREAKP